MSEVQEGFLCPLCMVDLGSAAQLELHFEQSHSTEENNVVVSTLKTFFKSKLNKEAKEPMSNVDNVSKSEKEYDEISGVHFIRYGHVRDVEVHQIDATDAFVSARKKRLDRNQMRSQLVLRLSRLLSNLPSDGLLRREHEQRVVQWLSESSVDRCPLCTRSFNAITKRKHHCRLCGTVLCHECSRWLQLSVARRIADVDNAAQANDNAKLDQDAKLQHLKEEKEALSAKDGLSSKLVAQFKELKLNNSFSEPTSDPPGFRCCHPCHDLALTLDQVGFSGTSFGQLPSSQLVEEHAQMRQLMLQGEQLSSKYRQMAQTLSNGEEAYTVQEAKQLRLQLLHLSEKVDHLSKQIVSNVGGNEVLENRLRQRIRQASTLFIKESLIALPVVPTEAEFEQLRRKRIADIRDQVQRDLMEEREARLRLKERQSVKSSSREKRFEAKKQWANLDDSLVLTLKRTESEVFQGEDLDDPILQQMHNLRHFIQEAKRMRRFEEVRTLEANLSDLRAFYKSQQEQIRVQELQQGPQPHYEVEAADGNASPKADVQAFSNEKDEYDAAGLNPFC